MRLKNSKSLKRYLSVCIITILFIQLPSCIKKGKNIVNTEAVEENDTVISLIKQSRNSSLSDSLRLNFLNKAQSIAISSLNDSLLAKYFGLLSYQYSNLADSTKFRQVNKKAIELNIIQKDSLAIANAYWDLASFYERLVIKDSAFFAFRLNYF